MNCDVEVNFLNENLEMDVKVSKGLTLYEVKEVIVSKLPNFGFEKFDILENSTLIVGKKIMSEDLLVGEMVSRMG